MAADGCQGVTESCFVFFIPFCLAKREFFRVEHFCHDDNQAENAEQARRGVLNGPVRPLSLSFKTELGTHFFKSHFNVPTRDVRTQNKERFDIRIVSLLGVDREWDC